MLKKLSDLIYKITGIMITAGLAVIVALSFFQVVSRYVFSFSIAWAQELVTFILVWLVFLGCSMGLRDNEVAALTIMVDKFSPWARRCADTAVQILLILFCGVGFWANREVIANMWNVKSSILNLSLGYVSLAFSASALIIILNSSLAIWGNIKGLRDNGSEVKE